MEAECVSECGVAVVAAAGGFVSISAKPWWSARKEGWCQFALCRPRAVVVFALWRIRRGTGVRIFRGFALLRC